MKTISSKISFSIALCSIIVAMLLGLSIYIQSETALTKEAEQQLLSVLHGEAEAIDAEFSRIKQLSYAQRSIILNTFDYNKAISDPIYMNSYKLKLSGFIKSFITDFNNISAWMLFNSEVIPGTNTVSYTLENGNFIKEAEYDAVKEGYDEQSWWREAINRGEYWSEPYYWEPWNADIVSFSIPVYVNNKLIGTTGAELFLSSFQDRLKDIKIYDSGSVILLTDTGNPVFIPDGINAETISKWYSAQKKYIDSNPNGMLSFDKSSEYSMIAWNELSNGWLLIALPKTDEMYDALESVSLLTLLCLLLSIPLSIAIGIGISRSLTKPLHQLTKAAENSLSHNHVDFRVIDSSPEEIKTLSLAFFEMQKNVKSALKELSINERKYRSLVENSDNIIFTINSEGYLITTNKTFEKMFNVSKDSLIGLPFTKLFKDKQSRNFWKKIFLDIKENKKNMVQETYYAGEQGEKRTLITSLIPILDAENELSLIMGTSTDITESLKIETEKNASLSRLVAGIGHEINTPLGNAITVSGFIESNLEALENNMLSGSLTKENLVSSIENIHTAMESLSINLNRTHTLIESFKNLSVDQSDEHKTTVVLSEIFTLLKINFENMFAENNCSLEFSCAENIVLKSIPSTLLMILTQLIENALYHAFPENMDIDIDIDNQKKAQVWVSAFDGDNSVSISVKDNGKGMSKDVVQKIFEPFYTTDRKAGRTGLGLSIVFNSVVNQLGGNISCNSDEHMGTVFTIKFEEV